MMNRKVLFLTFAIYIAFLGSASYADITVNSINTPISTDGKLLIAPGVPATFEITITPTESLGTWENLTLKLSDSEDPELSWLSNSASIDVVISLSEDSEILSISEPVGTSAFSQKNNTVIIQITGQTIDRTRKYLLSITPNKDIIGLAVDKELTLIFENFKFENSEVELGSEFALKIKESIVTDLRFDPAPPVERFSITPGGILNEIAKISIEFNQPPGGVWEELKLELKDVDWLADNESDVKVQVYRDRGENEQFNEYEDALVGQGRFTAAGEKISTDIFLSQSVPQKGVYFLVLILDQIVPAGEEMTLVVPDDGFLFTNARTGPRNGEFKLVTAGEQKIRVMPYPESPEFVPYESSAEVASIEIITDSKVKYLSSLVLGKPNKVNSDELISSGAVSLISIYRDNGTQRNKLDSTDTLIGQVDGFGDTSVEVEFSPKPLLSAISPENLLDFDSVEEEKINRFLLIMKAGAEDVVEENDRLDAVIGEDAFNFENRYLFESTEEKASPEKTHAGTSGPSIGKPPETYVDLSICKSDTVDDKFQIDYIAKSETEGYVEFFYTNKTKEELQTEETENILAGYIGSSPVSLTREENYIQWDTAEVSEDKYYIYARIVDTPLTGEVTVDESINIISAEDTVSAFSDCIVTIIHPLSIRELTPLKDAEPQDGFYLIEWKDKKNSYNALIKLYYSEEDLDPDNKLDEYNLTEDWKIYGQKLEDQQYKEVVRTVKENAKFIDSTEEDKDGSLGQYKWNLAEDEIIEEGDYYIYAVISDAEYEAAARSVNMLHVGASTYKPMIKLISPVSGSQATRSYTISWIDRDADDDAKINLYYSKNYYLGEKKELNEFVEDLAVKGKSDEESGIIAENLSEDRNDNRGFYTWELDEKLSGFYYVYAKILDHNNNVDYTVSPGTLLFRQVELRLSPSIIAVGKDETSRVLLQVKSPEASISGVNIYMSYDPGYLEVVGEPPFSTEVEEVDEKIVDFFTKTIQNKNDPERGHLYYSVSAELDSPVEEPPNFEDFQTLAVVEFKVIKVEERTINSAISFDFDEAHNRNTSVLTVDSDNDEKNVEVIPESFNPALTVQIVPMAKISGSVLLEGRTDHSSKLFFAMRRHDTLNDDRVYIPEGTIQSNSDGSYTFKAPGGIWELVVKTPSYLRSQYRHTDGSILLRIAPGENLQDIDIPGDAEKLIGGDVNDDNRINITDLSLLSKSFGLSKGEEGFNSNADIDSDGRVIYTDFVILAKNFGKIGAPDIGQQSSEEEVSPPVAEGAAPSFPASISLGGKLKQKAVQTGEIVEIPIRVSNAVDLKGFAFEVEYNPEVLKLVGSGASEGDFLRRSNFINDDKLPVLFISKEIFDSDKFQSTIKNPQSAMRRVISAGIIAGSGSGISGSGMLAKLRFESIASGVAEIRVDEFMIADSSNKFTPVDYRAVYNLISQKRPTETKLMQNFPNPFNPETWIPFTLNSDSNVEIRIYSQNGQLIERIELGYLKAGNYTHKELAAYWDGRNNVGEKISSGVYFYQLKADTATGSIVSPMKKMVILK